MKQRIFDAHLHIIDPAYPLVPNKGYLPAPFTVSEYLQRVKGLGIAGGAVVSGSFQGYDQTYLTAALQRLGPGFVGVAQLPASVSDAELRRLNDIGVRGLRFNLKRGGAEQVEHLDTLARRVYDLGGWHVELYVDSRELAGLAGVLSGLPAVSIDHLGLSREGLPALLMLVGKGVRVKASGFGRVDFSVSERLRQIFAVDPQALMFGTDLPSTRALRPFRPADIKLIGDTFGPDGADLVLWKNAARFYHIEGKDRTAGAAPAR